MYKSLTGIFTQQRQLLQRREPQRTVCSSRETRPRNCRPQRTGF
ncbi:MULTISPECIES: hypothetical protein [unclassified Tolypothrix]|nr:MULTISPECIES: hypothetical protein [unclassified Tolypothrix]EKF05020.1 hypothetical protein FDUTEX481_01186 [Tolypothrix sp. PCC 7601]